MKKKNVPGSDPSPFSVTFHPGGEIESRPGESLLNAAWRAGVPVDAPCGGQGWCGRCRVIVDPPTLPSTEEKEVLSSGEIDDRWRLACRTFPDGPSKVTLPPSESGPARLTALEGIFSRGKPPGGRQGYGVALDLGTTTLAAQLWDLASPRLLGAATAANPQSAFGFDVISRITSSTGPGGLDRLSSALRRGAAALMEGLLREHGLTASRVTEIVLAGNTTMEHFFAGIDPASLARAPFRPAFLTLPPAPAPEFGLGAFSRAEVHLLPNASAFLGGDALGGVLALDSLTEDRPVLLIDMGTNAEILLLRSRSCLAASAAAGPALEGGNISSGMQAMPGAVEEVDFNGDLVLRTLGDLPPRGLCGSGLIDLVALLVRLGFILPDGRLLSSGEAFASPWKKMVSRLSPPEEESSFTVQRGRGPRPSITLTQEDIRQFQLAKAAITTGWQLLLKEGRLGPDKMKYIFLSGGFGYGLRPRSLVTLGIIPPAWEEKLSFPGNTSLAGAARYLLLPEARKRLPLILGTMKTRHLAESKNFQKFFLDNMAFPG
jgi:uncharacterized 2Fe-2S/4Fe-4S cluster protein (DUF4445 family)